MRKLIGIGGQAILVIALLLGMISYRSSAQEGTAPLKEQTISGVEQEVMDPSQTQEPRTQLEGADLSKMQGKILAMVELYQTEVVSQDGGTLSIGFVLENKDKVQPGVKYSVMLTETEEAGGATVHQKVYDETLVLKEKESLPKLITYEAPDFLKGTYEVWVMVRNENGFSLANAYGGKVTLEGTGKYIKIMPKSCTTSVGEEPRRYELMYGVDVDRSEQLFVECDMVNRLEENVSVKTSMVTYWRSVFGKQVADSVGQVIEFSPGEKKTVKVPVPLVNTPQAYDVVLTLINDKSETVSNDLTFHYVLRGASATVQNLILDKDYYAAGDHAVIRYDWSPAADNFPGSRKGQTKMGDIVGEFSIVDGTGQLCIEPIKKTFTADDPWLGSSLNVIVTKECRDPKVAFSLKDSQGKTLDRQEMPIKSKLAADMSGDREDTGRRWSLNVVLALAVGFIVSVGIISYILLRMRRQSIMILWLLVFIGWTAIFTAQSVQALTMDISKGTPYAYDATLTLNFNKSSYAPNETMTVSGYTTASVACGNLMRARAEVTINGHMHNYNYSNSTDNFTAPGSIGTHWGSYVTYGCHINTGTCFYGPEGSFAYYVVAPTTPAANITANSTTRAVGETSTISWSSTNATWCTRQTRNPSNTTVENLASVPTSGNFTRTYEAGDTGTWRYYVNCADSYNQWSGWEYVDVNVTTASYALNVSKSGTGSGTVTSSPVGINCGTDCAENYSSGTSVTLTASAAMGSTFTGWSGACTGIATCTVTMSAARNVTANFNVAADPVYTLTVSKGGTGSGTVTSTPVGISCGSDCDQSYTSGTSVTLTASAVSGSTFTGWSGACTGTGTCTVTMSAARNVTANFGTATPSSYTLTVTKSGSGEGLVTSSPAGISCGSDCTESYATNTSVTLIASATFGSTFIGWGGACSGTSTTCTVSMSALRNVSAQFDVVPTESPSAGKCYQEVSP